MCSNFGKLPDEKKNKIIQASVREFADKGYSNASTNSIVKEADISKGALFNYFGNKKNLYFYIVDYMVEYYTNYMIKKMEYNNPDIFQRILDSQKLKISISSEHPIVYKFFASVFFNPPIEIKHDIEMRYKRLYEQGYKLATENIDFSKFRDDIDHNRALELIIMSLNGILGSSITEYKASDDYGYRDRTKTYERLNEYIDILRKVFYK